MLAVLQVLSWRKLAIYFHGNLIWLLLTYSLHICHPTYNSTTELRCRLMYHVLHVVISIVIILISDYPCNLNTLIMKLLNIDFVGFEFTILYSVNVLDTKPSILDNIFNKSLVILIILWTIWPISFDSWFMYVQYVSVWPIDLIVDSIPDIIASCVVIGFGANVLHSQCVYLCYWCSIGWFFYTENIQWTNWKSLYTIYQPQTGVLFKQSVVTEIVSFLRKEPLLQSHKNRTTLVRYR